MHVRVFKSESATCEVKEISMLTNRIMRFEMHAAAMTTPWSLVGQPGVSSSVYCLGLIPTISSIGGKLLQGQIEDLNSLQANFDSRQLQM
jgi:hypothetical protein